MYMIDRMLPEYSIVTLQEVNKKISERVYYEKLKRQSQKNFLQWVKKQLQPQKLGDTEKFLPSRMKH